MGRGIPKKGKWTDTAHCTAHSIPSRQWLRIGLTAAAADSTTPTDSFSPTIAIPGGKQCCRMCKGVDRCTSFTPLLLSHRLYLLFREHPLMMGVSSPERRSQVTPHSTTHMLLALNTLLLQLVSLCSPVPHRVDLTLNYERNTGSFVTGERAWERERKK